MAETASNMIVLGSKAPKFSLIDTRSDQRVSFEKDLSLSATVIMFLCNHCPYVKHIQTKLVELTSIYQKKGIRFIAISSNDAEHYPDDGPEAMKKEAVNFDYCFPYLYDETQEVARLYHAACTPDFFIYDRNEVCVYRGCFDESTPGNDKLVTGAHLRNALDNILAGKEISTDQRPSLGCSIKWKSE